MMMEQDNMFAEQFSSCGSAIGANATKNRAFVVTRNIHCLVDSSLLHLRE